MIEVALDAASTKRQDIVDVILVGWQATVLKSNGPAPAQFVVDVCNFVFCMDSAHATTFEVSFLELLFMMGNDVVFPASSPRDGTWVMSSEVHFVAAQLTVASKLRLLQGGATEGFQQSATHAFGCWWFGSFACWGVFWLSRHHHGLQPKFKTGCVKASCKFWSSSQHGASGSTAQVSTF